MNTRKLAVMCLLGALWGACAQDAVTTGTTVEDTAANDAAPGDAEDASTIDTVGDTVGDAAGDTTEADADEPGDEALCVATGGTWAMTTCHGFHDCAAPPLCGVEDPRLGCVCDDWSRWTPGVGCARSDTCPRSLCEDSGGFWDVHSCGDYYCGDQPLCDAIIPGCNCGSARLFTAEGCVVSEECTSP